MGNKRAGLVLRKAKLVAWTKSILSKFRLRKSARAGIVVGKNGVPKLFLFDTPAFLDLLSTIDEALVDRLTDEEYHARGSNPAGWLLDEIEAKLPPNPKFVQTLKDAIEEAKKKGWIPFSKVLQPLRVK